MIIALCFYQITAIVEEKSSWILHVQCNVWKIDVWQASLCLLSLLSVWSAPFWWPARPWHWHCTGMSGAAVMTHSASSIYNCGVCGPEAADKWNKMNESPTTMTMSLYLFSKLFGDLICVPQSPFNPIHGMHELLDTFCVIYEGPVWKD